MPSEDLKFVSLFSGAGGLDLGLESAGWHPLAQIELHADAVGTLKAAAERRRSTNQSSPATVVLESPIEDVSPRELRARLGLSRGELQLLAGGPPCQPFTTSGLRQSILDPRASTLWPSYFEYVDVFDPEAVLIENVDGMLSAALRHRPLAMRGKGHPAMAPDERKGSFIQQVIEQFTNRGYTVTWGLVEAADYGAAQMRQRAILVGVKGNSPCFLPVPNFGQQNQPPYRTLRDVLNAVTTLGAVQPLSSRKKTVYEQIPAGGNWRDLPVEVQRQTMGRAHLAEGGKSGWWRRLSWDAPAPTILGMPDHSSTALIHPDELRCLSVNECAAIQGFPAEATFAGSSRSQYQQIGNAVPVPLAHAVGRHIAEFLKTRFDVEPPVPAWRKASANRRIGTHGWAIPRLDGEVLYHFHAKVRPDHVWAEVMEQAIAG